MMMANIIYLQGLLYARYHTKSFFKPYQIISSLAFELKPLMVVEFICPTSENIDGQSQYLNFECESDHYTQE